MERQAWFIVTFALFVTVNGRPATAQDAASVVVAIHDSSGVDTDVLEAAKTRASAVFARAGVAVDWSGADAGFRVQVLLRPRNAHAAPGQAQIMGVALAADERRAALSLFLDAVTEVARRYGAPVSEVLGIALAHEMGHVLLPPPSHSADGIMQATWEGDDLRHALLGELSFTVHQAAQMQDRLRRSLRPAVLEGDGAIKDRRARP
jgi:hypothetical protein